MAQGLPMAACTALCSDSCSPTWTSSSLHRTAAARGLEATFAEPSRLLLPHLHSSASSGRSLSPAAASPSCTSSCSNTLGTNVQPNQSSQSPEPALPHLAASPSSRTLRPTPLAALSCGSPRSSQLDASHLQPRRPNRLHHTEHHDDEPHSNTPAARSSADGGSGSRAGAWSPAPGSGGGRLARLLLSGHGEGPQADVPLRRATFSGIPAEELDSGGSSSGRPALPTLRGSASGTLQHDAIAAATGSPTGWRRAPSGHNGGSSARLGQQQQPSRCVIGMSGSCSGAEPGGRPKRRNVAWADDGSDDDDCNPALLEVGATRRTGTAPAAAGGKPRSLVPSAAAAGARWSLSGGSSRGLTHANGGGFLSDLIADSKVAAEERSATWRLSSMLGQLRDDE